MRRIQRGRGLIVYEQDRRDLELAAAVELARRTARSLGDGEAARVGALFAEWTPGTEYRAGERVSDGAGNLYRVVQDHAAQADWPIEGTPALYVRLGVSVEEPEAVPEWRQPLGAEDAYRAGDRVRWQGRVYECTLDANVWAPDARGWSEVAQ